MRNISQHDHNFIQQVIRNPNDQKLKQLNFLIKELIDIRWGTYSDSFIHDTVRTPSLEKLELLEQLIKIKSCNDISLINIRWGTYSDSFIHDTVRTPSLEKLELLEQLIKIKSCNDISLINIRWGTYSDSFIEELTDNPSHKNLTLLDWLVNQDIFIKLINIQWGKYSDHFIEQVVRKPTSLDLVALNQLVNQEIFTYLMDIRWGTYSDSFIHDTVRTPSLEKLELLEQLIKIKSCNDISLINIRWGTYSDSFIHDTVRVPKKLKLLEQLITPEKLELLEQLIKIKSCNDISLINIRWGTYSDSFIHDTVRTPSLEKLELLEQLIKIKSCNDISLINIRWGTYSDSFIHDTVRVPKKLKLLEQLITPEKLELLEQLIKIKSCNDISLINIRWGTYSDDLIVLLTENPIEAMGYDIELIHKMINMKSHDGSDSEYLINIRWGTYSDDCIQILTDTPDQLGIHYLLNLLEIKNSKDEHLPRIAWGKYSRKFLESSNAMPHVQLVELLSIKSNTGKPLFQDDDISNTLDTTVPVLSMQQGYPAMQQGYPAMQQGYHPAMQQGYPAMQQGYHPAMQQGYPAMQQGYPAMQQGYPAMQQGYHPAMQQGYHPAMQQGYPAMQQGYPAMQQGYPAMQPLGMYPPYSVSFQSINYNLNVPQPQVLNSGDKTQLLHIETESGDNNISNNRTSSPKFSIGGHFPSLIQTHTYVDKTELISELINCRNDKDVVSDSSEDNEISSENKVYLITCPRRFGKSSNMAMIKYFLGMEVDKNGEKLKGTDTKFYNILQDSIKTKNIKIWDNKHFMQSYFKKFPIIHIDCQNIIGDTLDSLKEHLRLQLYNVFQKHSYLISALFKKSKNLEHDSTDYYDIMQDLDNFKKYYSSQVLNDAELQNGFKFLSELLSKYYVSYDTNKIYGTQVIILMDEYDAPINYILSQNLKGNTDVIDQIRKFYDHMLCQTFKGNDALYMGIMTGISGMLRASADSKLNNVLHWKFLGSHNRFQKYYGFNDKEVDFILEQTIQKHNNLNFDKDYYRNKISKYYGGYYNVRDDVHLYNPWSVISVCEVLNDKKCPDPFKSFWSDTGTIESLDNVFKIPKIRNVIQELIKDGYYPKASDVEYKLLNKLKIDHLIKLNQFSSSNFNCVDHQTDEDLRLFFSYIFELGYITPNRKTTQYSLPNEEIREEFSAKCIEYITQKYNISLDLTNNATSMFDKFVKEPKNEDNAQEFLNSLRNIMQSMNFKKMNDTQEGLHHNEAIFHTLLNWIIMQSPCLRKFGTEVITKHPIELGRADIAYISDSGVGIIIEVKYSNGKEHDLIKNLNNALTQINTKHYDHIFQHPNLKNQIHEGVLKLAVVFNIDNYTNKQVGIKFNYDVINNGVIVKDIEPKLLTSVSDSTVLSDVVMETNTTDALPAISEDYIDVSLSGNIDLSAT